MKRFHVHVHVEDLQASINFYQRLFAAQPTRVEADYAKWMLEDPRVNFAISTRGSKPGLDHLGFQTDTTEELAELKAQAQGAEMALLDEGAQQELSAQCETTAKLASGAPMSVFERYLTVWVFLCIVAGIALGQVLPGVFQAIGRMEVAKVNLPVGLLIWVMVIPMLVKVDFGALGQVRQHMKGIGVTLFVNWLVKPFSMALLAWIFVRHWFAPMLPPTSWTATWPG
jgi:hypothetical protein